jgi:glycosyltransferase involved in cell wall biosynthesis
MAAVDVVIPAFNAEHFIAAAIESALAQQGDLVGEIIVVDDGSADATARRARSYAPRVRVVTQENLGPGAARNRGIAEARAATIAFLDADDMFAATALQPRVALLAADPQLGIVFPWSRRFAAVRDGRPVPLDEARPAHLPGMALVRRGALDAIGPFDAEAVRAEGVDWLLRARDLGIAEATVAQSLVWRRIHGENNSLRNRDEFSDFTHALKRSLDRRRSAAR